MKAPTPEPWYFRSLHYGYSPPNATVVLWWRVAHDATLHIQHEWRAQQLTIADLAAAMRKETLDLGIEKVRHTAAHDENIGTEGKDGESRAETFAKHKVPLRILTIDPVQGWTRVRELLGTRPDGRPWLTIHPTCQHLIRAIGSAVQDPSDAETIQDFGNIHPLNALRIGAMSRPAPNPQQQPEMPKTAVGYLVNQLRAAAGATSQSLRWR